MMTACIIESPALKGGPHICFSFRLLVHFLHLRGCVGCGHLLFDHGCDWILDISEMMFSFHFRLLLTPSLNFYPS